MKAEQSAVLMALEERNAGVNARTAAGPVRQNTPWRGAGSIWARRLPLEGLDQHLREINGPGFVVLRFGQVDELALQIELAKPYVESVTKAHACVEQEAKKQPKLAVELVGCTEKSERLL